MYRRENKHILPININELMLLFSEKLQLFIGVVNYSYNSLSVIFLLGVLSQNVRFFSVQGKDRY